MQERRNSSTLAMELRLSCINPSISSDSMMTKAKNNKQNYHNEAETQNGRHFANNIFEFIFSNTNFCLLIRILMKNLFPRIQLIKNKPAMVQIMVWHQQPTSHDMNQWCPGLLMCLCILSTNTNQIANLVGGSDIKNMHTVME